MKHLTETQIQLLIDSPDENKAFLNHIHSCSQCQEVYQSLLDVHVRLTKMEYEKPSMRFAKNIYEIISRKQQLEVQEMRWIRIIKMSLLSSVFLGFILAFYYIFNHQWEIPINVDSIPFYYNWSITILLSMIIMWILYGIDQWYGKKRITKINRMAKS